MRRAALRLLAAGVTLGLLALVAVALARRWDALVAAGGLPDLGWAAVATAIYLGANVVLAMNWRRLMVLAGAALERRTALWAWSSTQLARYAFSLGQIGGRAVASRRQGHGATAGLVTGVLELLWFLVTTSTLLLATLPWWIGSGVPRWLAGAAVLPLGGIVAAIAAPGQVLAGLRRLARWRRVPRFVRRRLEPLLAPLVVTRRDVTVLAARYGLNSGLRITAFLIVLGAAGTRPLADFGAVVGAYAVGSFLGGIALFAPGGLGVREGSVALLLEPVTGLDAALITVATIRVLEIVAEVALLGVARVLRRGTAPVPARR
ncbi:MAG: flippase-like domain-containing protein [Actinobacteria bacterium]|nr:flippase-like domain-containing protein [Actinomycetota bacterium]